MLTIRFRSHRCKVDVTRFSTVEKRRRGLATLISNLSGILLKGPFGGLPVNVQLVPHHMHAHNPTVRVELEERTNLDLSRRTLTRPWGRCRQGGSARGTTQASSGSYLVWGLKPVQPAHPSCKHPHIRVCTRVGLRLLPVQYKFGTTAAHRCSGNGCACRS